MCLENPDAKPKVLKYPEVDDVRRREKMGILDWILGKKKPEEEKPAEEPREKPVKRRPKKKAVKKKSTRRSKK